MGITSQITLRQHTARDLLPICCGFSLFSFASVGMGQNVTRVEEACQTPFQTSAVTEAVSVRVLAEPLIPSAKVGFGRHSGVVYSVKMASESTAPQTKYPDLDYRFLQYLGVSIDGEAALHGIYVPMLAGRDRVVDLGCGLGGFIKLLRSQGVDAFGVDGDPMCVAEARKHDIPVVQDDVLSYLRTVEPESLDAVFSAHLVEHLPYEVVLELIELSFRALRPGGRLLLATPNPRALVSHLELYTMHFGHVAMYHPNLLAFFMRYAGFGTVEYGENPMSVASNVAGLSPLTQLDTTLQTLTRAAQGGHITARAVIPEPANPFRRVIWHVKMGLVKWLVQPYYDQLSGEIAAQRSALRTLLEATQRPFESYVIGDKADG